MPKFIAVVRTIGLVCLLVYFLWALPLGVLSSSDAKQGNITVGLDVVRRVAAVGWLAIAWIGVDTGLSWFRAWSAGRKKTASVEGTRRSSDPS